MDYPINRKTLEKWALQNLERIQSDETGTLFLFNYLGSTCNNGGSEFRALFYARINHDLHVERAWIEIPGDSEAAACRMCSSPSGNPEEAGEFLESFKRNAEFSGKPLEEVILEEVPQNFAGCLCHKPMINQKWKMVLSTMHFALVKSGQVSAGPR